MFSCSEEKKDGSSSSGALAVTAVGFQNFGKVVIGQSKLAGLKLVNSSSSAIDITLSGLGDPFFFHRVEGDCNLLSIKANGSCNIIFKFTPTDTNQISRSIGVNSQAYSFSGKGLASGEISIVDNTWNASTFEAGAIIEHTFEFTNTGDSPLSEIYSNTDSFLVKSHNCGERIEPGESCSFILTAQKSIAQSYSELVQIYAPESASFYDINFVGNVTPSTPFGNIAITCLKTKLIANNTDTTSCTTAPIQDNFGNVVEDGYTVSMNVINLFAVGVTTQPTIGGQVTFNVRATDTIASSTIVLNSVNASGFASIDLTSGPPSGAINFQTFNNSLFANGTSAVTVKTVNLTNASGVLISNGEEIHASVSGPATIGSSVLYSFQGQVQIEVFSTTISGPVTVTLNADPIFDGGGAIIGYNSTGSFVVNFVPVPEAGNFTITPSHNEIYFLKNGSGYTDETTITIGPVLNIFGTPIGSGYNVEVSLSNGVHANTNSVGFTLVTDSNSQASFPIKGDGIRGEAEITAIVNGLGQVAQIATVGDYISSFHQNDLQNKLELNYSFADSRFTNTDYLPFWNGWIQNRDNIDAIQTQDNEYYGYRRASGLWKDIGVNARHYVWDCMMPVKNYVISTACADKRISGGGYIYNYFYPYLMIFDNINSPLTIGGNIGQFPNHASGFGGDVINPISLYNETLNMSFQFGGSSVYTNDDITYFLKKNIDVVNYSQLSLFAYMPISSGSFTDDMLFPMFASHSTKDEVVYFFGGLSEDGTTVTTGNELQEFKDGDLLTVSVANGPFGRPSGRYQNGVYFDKVENRVYIIGGINIVDLIVDDIWFVDLDEVTPYWDRVCSSCGLPDDYIKKTIDIQNLVVTGTVNKDDILDLDNIKPWKAQYLYSLKKIIMNKYRSSNVLELDISTGSTSITTHDLMLELAGVDDTLYHSTIDRFYKQKVTVDGSLTARYSYYDSDLGTTQMYMARVDLGPNAKDHALQIKPSISAWSENKTYFTVEYGAQAYVHNYNTNEWELMGSNTITTKSSVETAGYNITQDLTNPRDYVHPSGHIYLLIKPAQEIGYQNTPAPQSGESELIINHISVEGVY